MLNTDQLKEMIVDLQVSNAKLNVMSGNCPFAFFTLSVKVDRDCNDIGCTQCEIAFWDQFRKDHEAEIKDL